MNIQFFISPGEKDRFANATEAVIRNVGRGTRAATEQACTEILADSLAQVPVNTGALASTAFYRVQRRGDVKGYNYEGIIGYAGAAGTGYSSDTVNQKTGALVSTYATIVHEDLEAKHPVGKAKYLEDPVRAYGQRSFSRVAEKHWKFALDAANGSASAVPREV